VHLGTRRVRLRVADTRTGDKHPERGIGGIPVRWYAVGRGRSSNLGRVRVPPLQTPRLVVRELGQADRAVVERLLGGDRERWLRWTQLGYEQLAELHQPPYGERAIELRGARAVVGLVGLVPALGPFGALPSWPEPGPFHRPEVGLYWIVAPDRRGEGIASEAAAALIAHAFAELRLARVVATTEHTNLASIGVMRRLGMRIERNPGPEPEWFQTVGILDAPASGA
jgi:RimJ/RimL family protein N-acetyltransferase